jgi:hypothetical protein
MRLLNIILRRSAKQAKQAKQFKNTGEPTWREKFQYVYDLGGEPRKMLECGVDVEEVIRYLGLKRPVRLQPRSRHERV